MESEGLIEYSGEHLFYEFQMFKWATLMLPLTHGMMHNAVVECFGIHLRNLIEFFYPPQNSKEDDVLADAFFDVPGSWEHAIPESLKDARNRANKELSHLTTKRKSGNDEDKAWQSGRLFCEIWAIARKFAAEASRAKLHPRILAFLAE